MSHFKEFSKQIHDNLQEFYSTQQPLFRAQVSGDTLWATYLEAFPRGTDPIYITNTKHDCSCCKSFIRSVGNVVLVEDDGTLTSIWSKAREVLPYPYNEVAERMNEVVVASKGIKSLFVSREVNVGKELTRQVTPSGVSIDWGHFHTKVPVSLVGNVASRVGAYESAASVSYRSLTTISPQVVEQVLNLINEDNLYRGAEHKAALQKFLTILRKSNKLCIPGILAYTHALKGAAIRNTVIGTLLVDLQEGKGLEYAVKAFEDKVAPTNYRRPKALVTDAMVKEAAKVIKELGAENSLERRFATLSDLSINDVLWVNADTKSTPSGVLANVLSEFQPRGKVRKGKVEVTLKDFVENVLPTAKVAELKLTNDLVPNLVSLTAPVHKDSPNLFHWGNKVAWSYKGGVTDSIKERVKEAGGNVNADIRVSLGWYNTDDLDLYLELPNGQTIYYGNPRGILDVDMNRPNSTLVRNAVENMALNNPQSGTYKVYVHNFAKRETNDEGFTVQLANNGITRNYVYQKPVRDKERVHVLDFTVSNGSISFILLGEASRGYSPMDVWGLTTGNWVDITAVALSPNIWNGKGKGNKHYIFVLKGCINDEPCRGFYNEFLNPVYHTHKKAFELLGAKSICEPSDDQVSGVGVSSTLNAVLEVRVFGKTDSAAINYIITN